MRFRLMRMLIVLASLTVSSRLAHAQQLQPGDQRVLPTGPSLFTDPSSTPGPIANGLDRPTYLPDAIPAQSSPASIVLNLDYMLLRARRQSADFAIADPNTDTTPEGAVQSLQSGPSSGFRAGIALQSPGSPWAIGFTYSYYRASDSLSVVAPAGGELWATLTRPGTITAVDTANAATTWAYDLYDIDLQREFVIDPTFSLRVFAGARLANISQAYNVQYDGRDANRAQVNTGFSFIGAGLTSGLEADWRLSRGLGLFCWLRGGLIYGTNASYFRQNNDNGATIDANISDRSPETVPVLETGIGASWTYRRLTVRAGYEMTNWFQLISTPDFPDDVATGKISWRQSNLSLDGLFVRVSYSF